MNVFLVRNALFQREAGEKDEEGLQISQQILEMIPDIHSLWNYRREILEHLKEIL